MIDGNLILALIGCLVGVASFYFGRQTINKNDGKEVGSFATDLKYIKESVNRIETRLAKDVERLEGRIDEVSNQLAAVNAQAARAHESAKSAHKRQDEHFEREHDMKVV